MKLDAGGLSLPVIVAAENSKNHYFHPVGSPDGSYDGGMNCNWMRRCAKRALNGKKSYGVTKKAGEEKPLELVAGENW